MQEAATGAWRAKCGFKELGLPETKSGLKGYMVVGAGFGLRKYVAKLAKREAHEVPGEILDTTPDDFGALRYEEIESRSVISSVLDELDAKVGGTHAFVARQLLDEGTPTKDFHRESDRLNFLADCLGETRSRVQTIIDNLVEVFRKRSAVYTG